MNKLKFEGVPCHHKLIIGTFAFLLLIWCALILLDGLCKFFRSINLISENWFSDFWIYALILSFIWLIVVICIEVVSMVTGYWSKWQKPLLLIRRGLYGLGSQSASDNESKTILSEYNRSVNHTYILACRNEYKLVIPLPKGAISVSNALINTLDASNSAQGLISSDLKPSGFRINIRHKHFHDNNLFWILHK